MQKYLQQFSVEWAVPTISQSDSPRKGWALPNLQSVVYSSENGYILNCTVAVCNLQNWQIYFNVALE